MSRTLAASGMDLESIRARIWHSATRYAIEDQLESGHEFE